MNLPLDELLPSSASYFRLIVLFQWFLMALSVRPGKSFAILAHWFPTRLCASTMTLSSSSVQAVFFMPGFRWLCHLSRHCLPILPLRCRAMSVHFFGPYLSTNSTTFSSSCNENKGKIVIGVNKVFHLKKNLEVGREIFHKNSLPSRQLFDFSDKIRGL